MPSRGSREDARRGAKHGVALKRLGRPTAGLLAALEAALGEGDRESYDALAATVVRLRPMPVGLLEAQLRRGHKDDAAALLDALRELDEAPGELLPVLQELLTTDRPWEVAWPASRLVARLGAAAEPAVPALRALLGTHYDRFARKALQDLGRLP